MDDGANEVNDATDTAGTITEQEFDAAGRRTALIENKITGTAADKNRTTRFEYTSNGLLRKLIAENATTGNQQTLYVYGSSAGGITPAVYRNDLLRAVIYPDSDDTYSGGYTGTFASGTDTLYDRVEYKYNRQGQVIELTDQNGTVHEYDYDKAGRRTVDRVATLGTNVDGGVRRIVLAYEDRGMLASVKSYDATTAGNVLNEVALAYNGFGQLTADKQEHYGAVVTASLKVDYAYADGSSNHVRPTKIVYPGGREVHYRYTGQDDNLSRVSALASTASGGTEYAAYSYLGLGGIVKVDYTEPDLLYDLAHGGGSDPYDGLDRFGRVVDLLWRDYGANADAERVKHGYDLAGNRLWRECPVPAALSPAKHLDEAYSYDGLYQLNTFARGNLTVEGAIDSQTLAFNQQWTFDNTGNWATFQHDPDGGGWDLEQTRSHNKANETGVIGATTGTNWADPAHDAASNMTMVPQPTAPASTFTCKYDAWNRLAEVASGGNLLAEYWYDGLNRRVYAARFGVEQRHFYYSSAWQVIEERLGSSPIGNPQRQFIWGLRYIDDLILRDRDADTNPDGALEERLYALQDPNWNVTALCEPDGDVVERYAYDAYGTPMVLDDQHAYRTTSSYEWETRYAGYRWDGATGLYTVRRRHYLSLIGRFIHRDPIQYAANLQSLYAYVRGRPIIFRDAYGLALNQAITVAFAAR